MRDQAALRRTSSIPRLVTTRLAPMGEEQPDVGAEPEPASSAKAAVHRWRLVKADAAQWQPRQPRTGHFSAGSPSSPATVRSVCSGRLSDGFSDATLSIENFQVT